MSLGVIVHLSINEVLRAVVAMGNQNGTCLIFASLFQLRYERRTVIGDLRIGYIRILICRTQSAMWALVRQNVTCSVSTK